MVMHDATLPNPTTVSVQALAPASDDSDTDANAVVNLIYRSNDGNHQWLDLLQN